MYLPYHPAMHLSRFRNALTGASLGVCQELCDQEALLAPLEPSANRGRKAASDLPNIGNVLAKVWKWLRRDLLQSICKGFA